ncbi:MAG: acyltransferase [Clostridiaceae bacterium]
MEIRKRNLNLDFIRCVAVYCVLSVHFFFHNGFYETSILGGRMYAMVMLRSVFMICVPLFLILTGYLMNRKTFSKAYYKGIKKVLYIYVLASIACIFFRIFYLNTPVSMFQVLISITDFSGAPYAWYVEMYIGLFLIIPFLNLMYNGLKTKNQKAVLVLTFFALTSLPTCSNLLVTILPDWWISLYPITYYFIGAFISEFDIKIKKWINLILIMSVVLMNTALSIYVSHGSVFEWGIFNDWNGFGNVLLSSLIFIFLKHINLENAPSWIEKPVLLISELSLGIYLVSWIFDSIVYPILNSRIIQVQNRLDYYIIVVPLVFIGSAILSWLINIIYKGIDRTKTYLSNAKN